MKYLLGIFAFTLIFSLGDFAFAADSAAQPYIPMVGVPGLENANNYTAEMYVDALYKLAITVAGILAVIQIIFGGVMYMFDGTITHKEAGKDRIKGALFGLLIILSAVLLLQTINPDLLNLKIFNNAPSIAAISGNTDSAIRNGILKNNPVIGSTFTGKNSSSEHIAFIKDCLAQSGTPAQSGSVKGTVECRFPSSCTLATSCRVDETFVAQSNGQCGQCVPKELADSNPAVTAQSFRYSDIKLVNDTYTLPLSLNDKLDFQRLKETLEVRCLERGMQVDNGKINGDKITYNCF